MVDFSIADTLNYAECGSRLFYESNPKLYDTRESVSSYLVSNLLKFLFTSAESKKIPDLDKVNKQLNVLWSKIKNKISFELATNEYIIFQSFSKRVLTHFCTYERMEVIVNDQLFDFKLTEDTIKIPLTVFRSGTSIYVYYIDDSIFYNEKPIGYSFLAPLVYRMGREICKGHTYAMKPIIYRSQSLRTYQCIDNSRVIEALDNLTSGIRNRIFFPRVSNNCKLCKNKESCKWYDQSTPN